MPARVERGVGPRSDSQGRDTEGRAGARNHKRPPIETQKIRCGVARFLKRRDRIRARRDAGSRPARNHENGSHENVFVIGSVVRMVVSVKKNFYRCQIGGRRVVWRGGVNGKRQNCEDLRHAGHGQNRAPAPKSSSFHVGILSATQKRIKDCPESIPSGARSQASRIGE